MLKEMTPDEHGVDIATLRQSTGMVSRIRESLQTHAVLDLICLPFQRFGSTAAIIAIVLLLMDRSAVAAERIVLDDLGFKVAVKQNVQRIVSLVPTNSEMVCLLACEKLKGGTRYDEIPQELKRRVQQKQVEIIGGGFDANLEKIVQLQPDLILTNGPSQQRFAVPLKNMGYPVLSLWPRDMISLRKDFLLLGQLLRRERKAQQIIDQAQRNLLEIAASAKNHRRQRVYLQMWTEPLITVGRSSFPHWLVATAGGINVFGDMPFDSGQISLEAIIERNPEILIFLGDQKPFAERLKTQAGWSVIEAVRNERFCFIDERDIRRSVQFAKGLRKIHDCLFNETKTAPSQHREAN
jgi:ABC-type Fe3+-hydroxamate transport system substrate-binding protein